MERGQIRQNGPIKVYQHHHHHYHFIYTKKEQQQQQQYKNVRIIIITIQIIFTHRFIPKCKTLNDKQKCVTN